MASKAIATPFFRYVTKRNYTLAVPAIKEAKVSCSVLPNQTFVAALDNGSPVTRVTIAFRAGSRYEPPGDAGVAHVLRCAAGLTTSKASTFIIARKLAQIGANVSASGDREFTYYTLETTQDNLNEALECLNNMVSCQEFRPWELSDITPRLKYEIASLSPQMRAVDLLHKAAFRRGLGNSLFISPKRIGGISSETLQHFAGCTTTPNRCAVVVVGDTQDKACLVAHALGLMPCGADAYCTPSQYYAGQLRKEMGGDLAHVALALSGAPAGTPDSLAFAIAAKALGNGPSVKWGTDNTPLGRAVGNIGPYAAAGFNVSYSDAGLFGVVLSVPKDEACNATKAIACMLKNAQLDPKAIQIGRNQLRLQILSEAENGAALAESMAAMGLYTGGVKSPALLAKEVNSISDAQVCSAMSSAMRSGLSMGAAGNLTYVPYVDDLK